MVEEKDTQEPRMAPANELSGGQASEMQEGAATSNANAGAAILRAEPPKDFKWEEYGEAEDEYSPKDREDLSRLYEQSITPLEKGQIVKGKVIAITDKDVVLDIGYKANGIIPRNEFKDLKDLKVGDEVYVYVESLEDEKGQLKLSYKKARKEKAWENIVDAYESGKIIQGYVESRTKGGMAVNIGGLYAFLPGSQLDVKPIKDYDAFVGQTMDLKVVKLNKPFRNIVVSHKAIIEEELEKRKRELLSRLKVGEVLEGEVRNITSFGVFVDLNGISGMIHIGDLTWHNISHPSESGIKEGDKIKVVVLDYDLSKNRVSLGHKQLESPPWERLPEDFGVGTRIKGKVVRVEDYGAYVEVLPGVQGLLHVNDMTWASTPEPAHAYVKVGDEIEVEVLEIDRESRRLKLTRKPFLPNPWENIEERYPNRSKHKGIVRRITPHGLIIELEEGLEGYLHVSDLSYVKYYTHPREFAQPGDEVEVVVIDIDPEKRQIRLGHKQLEESTWEELKAEFQQGAIYEGKVIRIMEEGAVVEFAHGVQVFCPRNRLIKENRTYPKEGETLPFLIEEVNSEDHRIYISHVAAWRTKRRKERSMAAEEERQQQKEIEDTLRKIRKKARRSTLEEELDELEDIKKLLGGAPDETETNNKDQESGEELTDEPEKE